MKTILALDAAWTCTEPSGVALLSNQSGGWNCLYVAPSYDAFLSSAQGRVDWTRARFPGSKPDVPQLLRTAEALAGKPVDLVAIDMPIATVPFSTRRPADNAISTAFGRQGCSAHSPSATRPGPLGAELTNQVLKAGFTLATAGDPLRAPRQLIEVYPHPALLALLRASYRIPYKVQKSTRYWPGTDSRERTVRLLAHFNTIYDALRAELGAIDIPLPPPASAASLASLKRYEDALDAVVCGWVAVQFAEGNAVPYGDSTGAVWVPSLRPVSQTE